MTDTISESYTIGQAVIGIGGKAGYIAAWRPTAGNSFVLGQNMARVRNELEIVFPSSDHIAIVPDGVAAPWIDAAKRGNIPPADDVAGMVLTARAREAERRAVAQAAKQRRHDDAAAFKAECAARIPSWAKAAIVAEYVRDDCDIMSDYFGTVTERRVIIGWSTHGRDLFPEMRNAAATFPETAGIASADGSAEHREKYSMGAGYYLKIGGRYCSGWKVCKRRFYGDSPDRGLDVAEFHLPEDKPSAPVNGCAAPGGMTIEEHTHTKKGFQMHLCILAGRVERDQFDSMRDKAEALGGWYSRPWGKTPGGFAFRDRATAEAFAGLDSPDETGSATESPAAAAIEHIAGKLRKLADGMQPAIDSAFRDRLENTPKRMREAQSARLEGFRLQRAQSGLRALADMHESGTVPVVLASVTTKAKAYALAAAETRRDGGYYDAGHETGKPASTDPAAVAFWALLKPRTAEDARADELRKAVADLQFANIPGFFPTPPAIVAMMIDRSELRPEHRVLEPSAGSGNILDAIRNECPSAAVTAFEVSPRLVRILCLKGHEVKQGDFMAEDPSPVFGRVLMNPPFEAGQDIEHVRRAFSWLAPGGRLVAIMSPGAFYRSDRKATEFREWFESIGGEVENLPDGSFKSSGTGTAAVLVEVRK